MTRIRLARTGSVHQPHYRIVVADSHSRRDGKFIEILGSYHPLQNKQLILNNERSAYWISVGAQPSTTLISLLTKAGVKHPFTVRRKPTRSKPASEATSKTATTTDEPVDESAVEAGDEAVEENPVSDAAAEAQAEQAEAVQE